MYARFADGADVLGDWTWFFEEFAHDELELRPAATYLDATKSYRGREGCWGMDAHHLLGDVTIRLESDETVIDLACRDNPALRSAVGSLERDLAQPGVDGPECSRLVAQLVTSEDPLGDLCAWAGERSIRLVGEACVPERGAPDKGTEQELKHRLAFEARVNWALIVIAAELAGATKGSRSMVAET